MDPEQPSRRSRSTSRSRRSTSSEEKDLKQPAAARTSGGESSEHHLKVKPRERSLSWSPEPDEVHEFVPREDEHLPIIQDPEQPSGRSRGTYRLWRRSTSSSSEEKDLKQPAAVRASGGESSEHNLKVKPRERSLSWSPEPDEVREFVPREGEHLPIIQDPERPSGRSRSTSRLRRRSTSSEEKTSSGESSEHHLKVKPRERRSRRSPEPDEVREKGERLAVVQPAPRAISSEEDKQEAEQEVLDQAENSGNEASGETSPSSEDQPDEVHEYIPVQYGSREMAQPYGSREMAQPEVSAPEKKVESAVDQPVAAVGVCVKEEMSPCSKTLEVGRDERRVKWSPEPDEVREFVRTEDKSDEITPRDIRAYMRQEKVTGPSAKTSRPETANIDWHSDAPLTREEMTLFFKRFQEMAGNIDWDSNAPLTDEERSRCLLGLMADYKKMTAAKRMASVDPAGESAAHAQLASFEDQPGIAPQAPSKQEGQHILIEVQTPTLDNIDVPPMEEGAQAISPRQSSVVPMRRSVSPPKRLCTTAVKTPSSSSKPVYTTHVHIPARTQVQKSRNVSMTGELQQPTSLSQPPVQPAAQASLAEPQASLAESQASLAESQASLAESQASLAEPEEVRCKSISKHAAVQSSVLSSMQRPEHIDVPTAQEALATSQSQSPAAAKARPGRRASASPPKLAKRTPSPKDTSSQLPLDLSIGYGLEHSFRKALHEKSKSPTISATSESCSMSETLPANVKTRKPPAKQETKEKKLSPVKQEAKVSPAKDETDKKTSLSPTKELKKKMYCKSNLKKL